MITQARFTNYKLLRSVELTLGRLNVIVGANGVGKSTVLEGLNNLLQLTSARHPGDSAVGRPLHLFKDALSFDALRSHPDAAHFEIEVSTAEGLKVALLAKAAKEGGVSYTFRRPGGSGVEPTLNYTDGHTPGREQIDSFFAPAVKAQLSSVVRLRLDATMLAEDHYSEATDPRIGYDGQGLAFVLQYLQGTRDGTIDAIEKDLASIVPGAKRVRSLPAKIVRTERIRISVDGRDSWSEQQREYTGAGFEVEWDRVGWIPSRHLSEGTLLALGILTLLHVRPPRIVLLDDVDKALHPVAQRSMVKLLKVLLERSPDLQIVATAHSPFVLDELDPAEVLVAGSSTPGAAQIRRLDQHPSWSKRKAYLHAGEFWSAVGESWVAESKA